MVGQVGLINTIKMQFVLNLISVIDSGTCCVICFFDCCLGQHVTELVWCR